MQPYPYLAGSGRIGAPQLSNRIVLCPMGTLLSNSP